MRRFSEIGHFAGLQLQLEFIGNQGDEFRIGRFAFRIADSIAKKSLQSVQITTIPGYFDGVSDRSFHTAWRGLEGLCHLGVEYLGDGVRVPDGPQRGFQETSKSGVDRR